MPKAWMGILLEAFTQEDISSVSPQMPPLPRHQRPTAGYMGSVAVTSQWAGQN